MIVSTKVDKQTEKTIKHFGLLIDRFIKPNSNVKVNITNKLSITIKKEGAVA